MKFKNKSGKWFQRKCFITLSTSSQHHTQQRQSWLKLCSDHISNYLENYSIIGVTAIRVRFISARQAFVICFFMLRHAVFQAPENKMQS